MGFRQLDLELPGSTWAPKLARDALSGLRQHVPGGCFDEIELLVSELVTNSIRHSRASDGSGRVIVRISVMPDSVRVEVSDPGPGFEPTIAPPSDERTWGRGLFMVDQVADRWGVSVGDDTTVWFVRRTAQ